MLLEFNEKTALWAAIIGFILSGAYSAWTYGSPEIPFNHYFIILPTLFAVSIFHIITANRKTGQLIDFLNASRNEIGKKEIHFDGNEITMDSDIVQFQIVISIIFVSFTIHSRPYVFKNAKPWLSSIGYSALSLIMGPWSRKGIYATPISIWENSRFADKIPVREILLRIEAWGKPVKIT